MPKAEKTPVAARERRLKKAKSAETGDPSKSVLDIKALEIKGGIEPSETPEKKKKERKRSKQTNSQSQNNLTGVDPPSLPANPSEGVTQTIKESKPQKDHKKRGAAKSDDPLTASQKPAGARKVKPLDTATADDEAGNTETTNGKEVPSNNKPWNHKRSLGEVDDINDQTEVLEVNSTPEASPTKKARKRSDVKLKPKLISKLGSKSASKNRSGHEIPPPSPPAEDGDDEAEGEDKEDENIHLHGFSSESESSDDDGVDQDIPGIDVSKLPTIAKDDETVRKKLAKAKKEPVQKRGVLYLGRIPHGFYEDEMKSYFTQFGDVTRLRLSRSKKTGRSKHYAFIEFESASVAEIVSETMDNYLLMGHILVCKVIPEDEVHPELWIGANKKWRRVPHDRISRVKHNKTRTPEEQKHVEDRLLKRQAEKKTKLSKLGISYDIDAVGYKKQKTQ